MYVVHNTHFHELGTLPFLQGTTLCFCYFAVALSSLLSSSLQGMEDVFRIDSERKDAYMPNFHSRITMSTEDHVQDTYRGIESSCPGHIQDMLYACFMARFKIASMIGTGKYSQSLALLSLHLPYLLTLFLHTALSKKTHTLCVKLTVEREVFLHMMQYFSTRCSVLFSLKPKERSYLRKTSPGGRTSSMKEIWHTPASVASVHTNSSALFSLLGSYFDSYPLDRASSIAGASLELCSFWACDQWSMKFNCSTRELSIRTARNSPALQHSASDLRDKREKEVSDLVAAQDLVGCRVFDVKTKTSVFVVYAERYWGVASLKALVSR